MRPRTKGRAYPLSRFVGQHLHKASRSLLRSRASSR
ncbi:Uncharacterised protein [Vibrio cholerae]|nr:Uncharacterised protein [Vibrio cholerae]